MEVKRKPKTIAAIFIRYISLFCVNTLLILGILFLAFSVLINTGGIRRADDMQTRLNENAVSYTHLKMMMSRFTEQI